MLNDLEEWGAPERLGLRREPRMRAILLRVGLAMLLLGVIVFGLGALGAFWKAP
jgi:hypothetical protein